MRKTLLIGLAIAGAAAAGAASWWPAAPAVSVSPEAPQAAPVAEKSFGAWPARAAIGTPRGELFGAPPAPPAPAAAAPQAPAAPLPPPLPYRVAGSVMSGGVSQLLLAKGDAVLSVKEGDTLEGGYRVESIGAAEVTLVYLPLGVRERLPLAAPGARPAQVRWEGPQQVRAGTPFTVALRVTADEPLRDSPLELSFDAEVLEPVSVRPGKLFAAEGFAYRVSPDGSIFVGASGKAREVVKALPDAELVVFVFKPLRPAAATELKLASFVLQGALGKPIPVEQPGAYRATITP